MASLPSFIFFSLCDHDFSDSLEKAVLHIWENKEESMSEDDFQYWVALHTANLNSTRRICQGWKSTPAERQQTLDYLDRNLKVLFFKEIPKDIDHDHSSVMLDTHLGFIWRV